MPAPFVTYATLNPERPLDPEVHPGNLPLVKNLHVEFQSPVTFFVGENGSGKSTLLEAMAVVAGLPIAGGGMAEVQAGHGIREESALASSLRLGFVHQPKDRYFFRAETQAHFASLLDERHDDPHFLNDRRAPADPYARYGKRPLHQMSHGEAFLSVMQNRFGDDLYFMDEPESALSPQRQLTLLALMHRLVTMGRSQFFVTTHSQFC